MWQVLVKKIRYKPESAFRLGQETLPIPFRILPQTPALSIALKEENLLMWDKSCILVSSLLIFVRGIT